MVGLSQPKTPVVFRPCNPDSCVLGSDHSLGRIQPVGLESYDGEAGAAPAFVL